MYQNPALTVAAATIRPLVRRCSRAASVGEEQSQRLPHIAGMQLVVHKQAYRFAVSAEKGDLSG